MMHITQQKEQFSLAYIHAVATVAGYALADIRVDDDSVDALICSRNRSGKVHSPRVEIQAKCTAVHVPNETHLSFPLSMKNYDDLRDPDSHLPRLLIVVCVPVDVESWLEHSESQLCLKNCGYWVSLKEKPEVISNAVDPSVTVAVPRSQPFNVEQLRNIMTLVGTGIRP